MDHDYSIQTATQNVRHKYAYAIYDLKTYGSKWKKGDCQSNILIYCHPSTLSFQLLYSFNQINALRKNYNWLFTNQYQHLDVDGKLQVEPNR